MQTMIEKLRLIADAIEQGKDVEAKTTGKMRWEISKLASGKLPNIQIFNEIEYRIAPDKPLVKTVLLEGRHESEFVQLTPEVREALEAAGVEI